MGVELPFSALVEIVAYCLNPNHYHLIVKQISEKGIERFMQKIGTGYTNYFNKRYERSGALFQGKFKSIHIDSNEYLLHLSVYVFENRLGSLSGHDTIFRAVNSIRSAAANPRSAFHQASMPNRDSPRRETTYADRMNPCRNSV